MRRRHFIFIAVLLSLALHVCLILILYKLPDTPTQAPTDRAVLLDYIEPMSPDTAPEIDKQVVRQTDIPDAYKDETNDIARFNSEQTQRVLEESQAVSSGQTQNRSQDMPRNNRPKPRREIEFEPLHRQGDLDIQAKKELQTESGSSPVQLPWLSGLNLERGTSTVGESIPEDIKFGEFTALNTDRYLYYSFYARVEDMIRHRWIRYVRAVLYTYQNTRSAYDKDVWTTRMEIVLDAKGNFQKALMYQGSGMTSLDQAPVQAFREAAQIPNPPAEMVKSDGTIRLQYQFTVRFIPQFLASP